MNPRHTVFVMEAQAKAALPIIQSMARSGIRVAAAAEWRHNSGFYCRGCSERYIYPSPRHRKADFQQWMLEFVRRHSIDVLFPVGHYGAPAVCEIQDELRKHTRVVLPDEQTFRIGYEKIPTMKAAIEAGVPIPDSWFPGDSPDELERCLNQVKHWPILIKPSVGVGARGITWCHSADEVRSKFSVIVAEHGESYLQDFVPPGGMQYKVDMLVDGAQQLLGQVVYGKTRMYPPDGGSSVLNYSADRPDILEAAHRILVHLKWTGFCDFDFVVDPRDNVAKLMEINPRFPESFRAATCVGTDFPRMLFDLAMGHPVTPVLDYPKGRFVRFFPGDLLWLLRVSRQDRHSTWPSWFSFCDGRTTEQLFSMDDWGPMMGYVIENLLALLNPKLLRERLRLSSGHSRR